MVASGGNAEAARLAGVRVNRIRIVTFVAERRRGGPGRGHRHLAPAQRPGGQRRQRAGLHGAGGHRGRRHVDRRRRGVGLAHRHRRALHRADRQRVQPAWRRPALPADRPRTDLAAGGRPRRRGPASAGARAVESTRYQEEQWESTPTAPTRSTGRARVDMPRLREDRLAKLQAELERSDLGALLAFDFHNIRYMTGTHIGTWAMDKLIRFALLPRGGKPIVWDFGSAARHHQLYNPWLTGVQVVPDGSTDALRGRARRASRRCAARSRPAPTGPARWPTRSSRSSPSSVCRTSRSASTSSRCRCCAAFAQRGHDAGRRPAGVPRGRAQIKTDGRDRAADARGVDGRRRLRGALRVPAPRGARERVRRPGQQDPLRPGI